MFQSIHFSFTVEQYITYNNNIYKYNEEMFYIIDRFL